MESMGRQQGFALVELALALAITAVVVVAVAPTYRTRKAQQRHAEAERYGNHILDLAEAYRKKYGRYPPSSDWSNVAKPDAMGSSEKEPEHPCCPGRCLPADWRPHRGWDALRFEPANAHYGTFRFVHASQNKNGHRAYLEMKYDVDCDGTQTHYMFITSTQHEGALLDEGESHTTAQRKLVVLSDGTTPE